jgi:hypothetical protein
MGLGHSQLNHRRVAHDYKYSLWEKIAKKVFKETDLLTSQKEKKMTHFYEDSLRRTQKLISQHIS